MVLENQTYTVLQLNKMYKDGRIDYRIPIQRGYVWNKDDASLYIHSLFMNLLKMQSPIIGSRDDFGNIRIIDGQQRQLSVLRFFNNEYRLSGLEKEDPITINGCTVNINGKKYNELPEDFQWVISSFGFNTIVILNATKEDEALFFYRFNRGKQIKNFEMSKTKNLSFAEMVHELSQHPLFEKVLTEHKRDMKQQEILVVKCHIMMFSINPKLTESYIGNYMINALFTDKQKDIMKTSFDKLLDAYNKYLIKNSKAIKTALSPVNMIGYIKYIPMFDDGEKLGKWICDFFNDKRCIRTVTEIKERYIEIRNSLNKRFGDIDNVNLEELN